MHYRHPSFLFGGIKTEKFSKIFKIQRNLKKLQKKIFRNFVKENFGVLLGKVKGTVNKLEKNCKKILGSIGTEVAS